MHLFPIKLKISMLACFQLAMPEWVSQCEIKYIAAQNNYNYLLSHAKSLSESTLAQIFTN